MDVRSLGYRTDLMVRALEGSEIDDRGDYLVIRTPGNPTYWWGNFLLLSAQARTAGVGAWVAAFATEFPDARHVALGVDVTEVSEVNIGDFTAHGLRLQRSAVLTARDLNQPPHPNRTATIRQLSGDADWQQAARLRAVLSEGEPGAEPTFLRARVAAERALTEAGHGAWFGAFLDGDLVAQLGLVTDGKDVARYQNVETHPSARRKGLAGTLVWQAGRYGLTDLGASTLVMIADPLDMAIRVYRSVGFTDTETQVGFERQPA